MLKKKTIKIFGNKYYLLGTREDGMNVYMQEPEWQCGWYWGGLYLTCFTNNRQPERSRDICEHFHFDSTFLNKNKSYRDAFKEYFKETVLTDSEIYELCDYMKTFYTLKSVAELFKRGYDVIGVKFGNYTRLQVGAFKYKENCLHFIAQLNSKGISAFYEYYEQFSAWPAGERG